MKDVAIFVKSYAPDLPLVYRLLDSISKHNRDRIGVFISVPAYDVVAFQNLSRLFADVSVVPDDHFGINIPDQSIWGLMPGYILQQVIKLNVQRLSEAQNYVILDSDTYFIRDFETKDFVASDGTGLTVLSGDKDLMADPAWSSFAEFRAKRLDLIGDRLGVPTLSRATSHNSTVFQASVLNDLHDWRRSENLSLVDLMRIAPLEFTWYNYFLAKYCQDRLVRIEPFIRMFHTRSEYRRLIAAGFTHESLGKAYLGLCINSNWAGTRQDGLVSRLERGSWMAGFLVKTDRTRYKAGEKLKHFRNSHIAGASRHPAQVPEGYLDAGTTTLGDQGDMQVSMHAHTGPEPSANGWNAGEASGKNSSEK